MFFQENDKWNTIKRLNRKTETKEGTGTMQDKMMKGDNNK
jgi:hypothetical protein